jgi:hypothetical protein
LVWVWISARGTTAGFPQPLLAAEGILLTATVFFLSFGQSRHRRAADEALSGLRDDQKALLDAYDKQAGRMTSLWLYEMAAAQRAEALQARWLEDERSSELVKAYRQRRSLSSRRDELWDLGARYHAIGEELDGYSAPSPRRRELEQEQEKTRKRFDQLNDELKKSGDLVVDRLRVNMGATFELLQLARVFVSVIVTIALIGAEYAGWGIFRAPDAGVWAVVAFIGLALAYVYVVWRDVVDETRRVIEAVARAPLAALHDAEEKLCSLRDGDMEKAQGVWDNVLKSLSRIEREIPGLPWTQSLRGRQLLWCAGEDLKIKRDLDHFPERLGSRLSRNVPEAERLLRAAASRRDDPVAAVALARVLELRAELEQEDNAALSYEAGRLVADAADMLPADVDAFDVDDLIKPRGAKLAWQRLLESRSWLWPANDGRAEPLKAKIVDAKKTR